MYYVTLFYRNPQSGETGHIDLFFNSIKEARLCANALRDAVNVMQTETGEME